MRLCNEYRTAFKNVTDPASIAHLLSAGWREAEEESIQEPADEKSVPTIVAEATIEAPEIIRPPALKYKGQYLSWYAQVGTLTQLRDVLKFIGIPFDVTAKKKDLQAALREYLKNLKKELKEEAANDRK